MNFNDMLAADALAIAGGEFGEMVTYTPAGAAAGIPVKMIIYREQDIQEVPGQTSGYVAPRLKGFLSVGQGIASINVRGDTVTVALTVGAAAVALPVSKVLTEDPGGWMLELI